MANDLTVRALGLTVEYRPSGLLELHAAGLQVEYEGNKLATLAAGLSVEYSQQIRNMKVLAIGSMVEYSEELRALTVQSVGLTVEYTPKDPVPEPEGPPVEEPQVDVNDIPLFLSARLFDIRYVDVSEDLFANPDSTYTGYAADGFWYTNGVLDPTVVPFKATWAQEGESEPGLNRGNLDRFPRRLFVITTFEEVVLLNADDLTVWMRFTRLVGLSSSNGFFLGDASTELRAADFRNGILCVATNSGVRIADFKKDLGYLLRGDSASKSVSGLANRNQDAYLDGVSLSGPRTLVSDQCTDVSIQVRSEVSGSSKNEVTVAAVGHAGGLTGVRLRFPGISDPETLRHSFAKRFGVAWSGINDNDGDSTTNLFTDQAVSTWEASNVRPGDVIVTDTGANLTIVEVQANRLVVAEEFALSLSGGAYDILKIVRDVKSTRGGELYFSNGDSAVTHVNSGAWYEGTPIDAFSDPFRTVVVLRNTGKINDLEVFGGSVYVGSDVGVYFISEEVFEQSGIAELRYSITGQSSPVATYKILAGNFPSVEAIAIDPETSQLAVACTDGDMNTVISEVNLRIHKTFRFFTRRDRVTAMVGYRNPNGPPDVEVP